MTINRYRVSIGTSENQSLVHAGSGRGRAGALTNFCMLAAGGCTLLLSLLCSESTRNVSFSLRAAEGKGQLGMGPNGLPVPCGSLGYGKAPGSPWRPEGSEGSTGAQRGQGLGGSRDCQECTRSSGGGGPAKHCLHRAALVTSPEPIPSPTSPAPAPHPYFQPHNLITTPAPCLFRYGAGEHPPHPFGNDAQGSQAAFCPDVSRKPPHPLFPLPRGPGASGDSFSDSPTLQARQASSTSSRPARPLLSSMLTNGRTGEGREDLGRDEPVLRACVSASKI